MQDRNEVYTHDALADTTRLLSLNPEFQTGWGVRRRILLKGLLVNAPCVLLPCRPATSEVLDAGPELTLDRTRLPQRRRCAPAAPRGRPPAHQRVAQAQPQGLLRVGAPQVGPRDDARRRLGLRVQDGRDVPREGRAQLCVSLFLSSLARSNLHSLTCLSTTPAVHSWDYRRYLVSSIQSIASPSSSSSPSLPRPRTKPLPQPTTSSELAFTTRKISANFSNFSAWHYRTKLLQKLWDERGWAADAQERLDKVDEGAWLFPWLALSVEQH